MKFLSNAVKLSININVEMTPLSWAVTDYASPRSYLRAIFVIAMVIRSPSGGTDMRVVVLGATGGTGLEIVRRSLARGHSVTAFVRSADRLNAFRNQVDIRQGDLLNIAELGAIIKEHDAVLSGFGPRQPLLKSDAHLLEQFAKALTAAMECAAVKRVVVISTAFLFKDSVIPPTHLIGRLLFPDVVSDSAAMERVFVQSNLDWTIVRPPQLTDGPFTGKYRVRLGHLPRFGFKVSRGDVADFFVESLDRTELRLQIVGVSN